MARRGRPPKTLAERRLNGNAGKRKLPPVDDAPLAPGAADPAQLERGVAALPVPPPPAHLDKDAKAEWIRLASQLVPRGLLRNLDLTSFEMRCVTYSRWLRANRALKRGLTYAANGLRRKRPEVQIAAECERLMHQFDSEFGLTPAARVRVKHVTDDQPGQPKLPLDRPADQPPPQAQPPAPEGPRPDPDQMSDDAYFRGPRSPVH